MKAKVVRNVVDLIGRVGADMDEAVKAHDYETYCSAFAIIVVYVIAIYLIADTADDFPEEFFENRYIAELMSAADIIKWQDWCDAPGHYSRRVDISEVVSAWRLNDCVMVWRGIDPGSYESALSVIDDIQYKALNEHGLTDMSVLEIVEYASEKASEII